MELDRGIVAFPSIVTVAGEISEITSCNRPQATIWPTLEGIEFAPYRLKERHTTRTLRERQRRQLTIRREKEE